MLTRKHFQAVADVLRTVENERTKEDLISQFASYFVSENPRFDSKKFREAVLK